MNKLIFFVLCSILSTSLGKQTWFPDDDASVTAKCNKENNVTPEMENEFQNNLDTPIVHAIVLCRVKGINIYNDETGFNVQRMSELFFPSKDAECRKTLVQGCVDNYKDITSEGEKAFKTIFCIAKKEVDKTTTCTV